jgi:hypothetical protein
MQSYELSHEVEKVATKVIKQYHPDLLSKKVYYVIVDKKDSDGVSVAKFSKGHQIPAEIKVINGDAAFLISGESSTDDNGPLSVVLCKVYRTPWKHLKEETREALLDSQLCRVIYDDETGKPSILEYDAKVNNSNLKRYGAWNHEIERLFDATKELPLIKEIEKAESEVKVVKANGNGKVVEPENPSASVSNLAPLKDEVAKRRGKDRAARAGN